MSKSKSLYSGILLLIVLCPLTRVYAQVNLQTGSAVFSISMFNWQDDKSRLSSGVALNYSSGSGLKVNDVAGNVGQGWNLDAGGFVTRMQVGEPDDQQAFLGTLARNGVENDHDISKYPAGMLYAPVNPMNGCPSALSKYPIYGGANQIYTQHNILSEDRQMDYFAFQFNGKAGLFVIDTSGTGRLLGDSRMKVSFTKDPTLVSQGIRTTITSFTIQDVDGLIYKFTQHATTTVLHADFCDAHLSKPQTQPKFSGGNVYHQAGFVNSQLVNTQVINGWYLSEVDDPLTGRKITYSYVMRTMNNVAGADVTYNQNGNYSIISHKTSISSTPELSSIGYPDGHVVNFNYASTQRADLAGEYAISSVDILYNSRYLSEYQLNTSYFLLNRYGTPTSAYQQSVARLCLRSVRRLGVDLKEDTPPYTFDYYTGSSAPDDFIPPPFFYAKDIWGFYNGNNSVAYDGSAIPLNTTVSQLNNNQLRGLCFLNQSVSGGPVLNPKLGFAKNGLLRMIVYPTGGTLSYTYAQDTGVINGTTRMVGGVHVSQTSSTDGGYSNGCNNPIVTNYRYVLSDESTSSLWGLEMPINQITTSSYYASEKKKYHWTWSCAPLGCCYWKYAYPGIMSQLEAVDLSGFQKFMNAAAPVLGIVTIITDIMDIATIVGGSTGFLAIAAVVVDVVGALLSLGLTCFSGNNAKTTSYNVFYNSDLNGASPLPTQFKRVEIVEGSGTMGKTVQVFTSDDDYPILVPSNPDFSAKQRFLPWEYGLPKSVTLYDASGNPVRQTVNTYNIITTKYYWWDTVLTKLNGLQIIPPAVTNCKCLVNNTYSQNNDDWQNASLYNAASSYLTSSAPTGSDITVDMYGIYSGRAELTNAASTTYSATNPAQSVTQNTSYYYDTYNYQPTAIIATGSDGLVHSNYITYADYWTVNNSTTNPEINKLFNNNILNEPVIVSQAMSFGYMNYKATAFTTLANGNIKPLKIMEERFTQPTWNNVTTYTPDDPTFASVAHVVQQFTYSGTGNEIGVQDEGGRNSTNIFDYNDKYIVANVINANPLLDMPAYTSFETTGLGGWQLTGTAAYTSGGVTGTQAFVLSSGNSLVAPLNTAKPYTVSLWATAPVSVSGGGTLTKSSPTIGGYTYYEYSIPQGTVSIAVAGSATIDELRLYPKMARMQTTTYDPLIGKTSECDENNRVTYFEYDNLGRLRYVKDENHYMMKMYEYNNVSAAKLNGCPTTYTNNLVTEVFTRSNCGSGYIGGPVSYSVPAGRFTSGLSQADADAQAEIYLLTNGQAYADANGGCQLIYYNVVQSQQDSSQSCPTGQKGGYVTYTVPAGTYWSVVSQADADAQATADIAANAQAYANSPGGQVCSLDNGPDWESDDNAPTYCQNINGALPPHQFVLATDMNPNSPTYGQTQYMDLGPTNACPAGNYYNTVQSGTFYKNNCSVGTGLPISYSIAAGLYSSTVSQADANQQATNALNANGQAYANANGQCCNQTMTYTSYVSSYVLNDVGLASNGTQVNFTWVFAWPTGGYTSFPLGQLNGGCDLPNGTRTIPITQGSTVYNITVTSTGAVSIQIVSGPVPTGTIGFNGSYSLTQNAYYSAAASGTFTRNNCPAGQVGTSVTYSVPAYTYSSFISQADADQQAVNAVNSNGQNYANSTGSCNVVCGFNWASGITSQYSSQVSSSGTTVSFTIVFGSPNSSYTGGTVGTITGGCVPSGSRFFTITDQATTSRTWSVSVSSTGTFSISLASGSAAGLSGPPIVLQGSFSK